MKLRKLINFVLLGLIVILPLAGCGGGESSPSTSNTPTDTSIIFSTFPSTYFGGNYSASYSLSGSFSTGENATGTWSIQSGSKTSYNSQSVTTIDYLLSLTNTTSGATSSTLAEEYYATNLYNRTLIGQYTATDGVSSIATSTKNIPLLITIGDFGMVGSYSLSDSKSSSITWSLENGFNGKAKLVLTEIVKDTSNVLFSTEVHSWTITQDGTRESVQVTVTMHQSGNLTLTMTGNKS